MTDNSTRSVIESPADFGDDLGGQQKLWRTEISAAKKELEKWHKQGQAIVKILIDQRANLDAQDSNFNLFAANTAILKAALFSRIPSPSVRRRFQDFNDDAARVAALIVERALTYEVQNDPTFITNLKNAIEDRLVAGVGCAWVRYDAESEEQEVQLTDDENELTEDVAPNVIITDEQSPVDYVHWKDIFWSPARTWAEIRWIGRRVFMTKDEFAERFGDEAAETCTFTSSEDKVLKDSINPQNTVMQQVEVFELWDKTSKKVYWVCLSAPEVLDVKEDPLELPGFFPCPPLLIANCTSSNYIPVPDYKLVQDQYAELNRLNNRISSIVEATKVAGIYDKSTPEIANLLSDGRENVLIPADRWAAVAEKGGIQGAISFLPIEAMANVLLILQKSRDLVKAQIYELTGISDIIRGASSPYETAQAQEIKSQYASLRLSAMQHEVAIFMQDLLKLKAHLMVKFYEPERLLARCGHLNEVDMQLVPQAIDLLKNELLANYSLTISVDSLQLPNMDREKQNRTELLGAVSSFLEKALPATQSFPAIAPLLLNLLKFGVAGYQASGELEGILDQGLGQLQQAAANPQPKGPSPEELSHQLAVQKQQQDFQLAQAELQLKQLQQQNDLAIAQNRLQLEASRLELDKAKVQLTTQLTATANQTEAVLQSRAIDVKAEKSHLDAITNLHQQHLDEQLNRNEPTSPLGGK